MLVSNILKRNLFRLLPLLLFLAPAETVSAQDWKDYQAGEALFQAPSDWKIEYQQKNSGSRLKSPNGEYALLAQWWFPDETLQDGEVIVSRRDIVADGRPAKLIHSRFPDRQVLKLVLDEARDDKRHFIVALESDCHDFSEGSALHQEIVSRLRLGTPPPKDDAAAPPVEQVDYPGLNDHLGQDCRTIDPATWKHPALEVVRQRPSTHLQWVKLCSKDAYPVFGVRFDFDPQGQTKDFFHPLFWDVLAANDGRPLAFVEIQDHLLIQLRQDGKDQLDLNYLELDR
jgi:hypothetical protein